MPLPKSSSYTATVCSAYDLAEMLKRRRPHLQPEISQLENIVARTHRKLDYATMRDETDAALCELEAAYQALKDLRRLP